MKLNLPMLGLIAAGLWLISKQSNGQDQSITNTMTNPKIETDSKTIEITPIVDSISGVNFQTAGSTVVTTTLTPSGNTLTSYTSTVAPSNDPLIKVVEDIGGGSHYASSNNKGVSASANLASRQANLASIAKLKPSISKTISFKKVMSS